MLWHFDNYIDPLDKEDMLIVLNLCSTSSFETYKIHVKFLKYLEYLAQKPNIEIKSKNHLSNCFSMHICKLMLSKVFLQEMQQTI
jgi:hypothetical protein